MFVDRGGELVRQPVVAGTRDAAFTEIIQGVKPGDRVLVAPLPTDAKNRQEDSP